MNETEPHINGGISRRKFLEGTAIATTAMTVARISLAQALESGDKSPEMLAAQAYSLRNDPKRLDQLFQNYSVAEIRIIRDACTPEQRSALKNALDTHVSSALGCVFDDAEGLSKEGLYDVESSVVRDAGVRVKLQPGESETVRLPVSFGSQKVYHHRLLRKAEGDDDFSPASIPIEYDRDTSNGGRFAYPVVPLSNGSDTEVEYLLLSRTESALQYKGMPKDESEVRLDAWRALGLSEEDWNNAMVSFDEIDWEKPVPPDVQAAYHASVAAGVLWIGKHLTSADHLGKINNPLKGGGMYAYALVPGDPPTWQYRCIVVSRDGKSIVVSEIPPRAMTGPIRSGNVLIPIAGIENIEQLSHPIYMRDAKLTPLEQAREVWSESPPDDAETEDGLSAPASGDPTSDESGDARTPADSPGSATAESADVPSTYRTWKTADGKYEVVAEYRGFQGGDKVRLKKQSDGTVITVPTRILSKEDREYLEGKLRR